MPILRTLQHLVPRRLVPVAEAVYCWWHGLSDRRHAARTGIALPPARLRYQVGSVRYDAFIRIGKTCSHNIVEAARKAGKEISQCKNILDFGCGCGRTLMWLREFSGGARLHGTDLNPPAVEWCRQRLGFAEFSLNQPFPPLAYPPNTFDLIYAVSVFTHLDESLQCAWLSELRRVAAPGAILLVSVLGESCWNELPQDERAALARDGFLAKPSRSLSKIFPAFFTNTYHTRDYIQTRWKEYFRVRDYLPRGMNRHQDLVVLEKI